MIVGLPFTGGGCQPSDNQVIVKNQSGQTISVMHLTLHSWQTRFENLAPNAQASANFKIDGDDHFVINGQLADGTTFSGNYGYVTNGMEGERVVFLVNASGAIEYLACHKGFFRDVGDC